MSVRHSDLHLLHPAFERTLAAVVEDCDAKDLQLRVFETIRSPGRQEELFRRGRDPDAADYGRTVTKARAYESAHQYGLAADLVFWVGGRWSWEPPKGKPGAWDTFQAIARDHGLVTLTFERPHVQVKAFNWRDLERGPDDEYEWLAWLREMVRFPRIT